MNRKPVDVPVGQLSHAPWNPRATITPQSVEDLTASIRTDGLIQRIVVIIDESACGHYIVIAGNRRLVACKAAGLEVVPCELLDVDERTARRMTLIENLQRCDVDPLMEADLILGLTTDGMTIEAIAAETGRGEKWVWRRQQLTKLHKSWRKLAKTKRITVDCLEHVAGYPEEIQKKIVADNGWEIRRDSFGWGEIRHLFAQATRSLSKVPFCTSKCVKCASNSANAPMLFDWSDGKAPKLGECLNPKCYEESQAEHFASVKERAERDGCEIVTVTDSYKIPNYWNATPKKSEDNCVLYIVERNGKIIQESWSIKNEPKSRKETEEEKAEKARRKVEKSILEKLTKYVQEGSFKDDIVGCCALGKNSGSGCERLVNMMLLMVAFGCRHWNDSVLIENECIARIRTEKGRYLYAEDVDACVASLADWIADSMASYGGFEIARKLAYVLPEVHANVTEDEWDYIVDKKKGE